MNIPFRLVLALVVATTLASPPRSGAVVSSTAHLPQTFDEAVLRLVRTTAPEDLAFLKTVPRMDLVAFHLGWGMEIRNTMGLWIPRSALLAACARKLGKESIHPDEASSLLIEGVWFKLHEGMGLVDFDTVAPGRYFEDVLRIMELEKATGDVGYLASLPAWIYRPREYRYASDSIRERRLLERADSLALRDDTLSLLALRFGTFRDPGSKAREERLKGLLRDTGRFVEWPSYDPDGMDSSRSFFPPWRASAARDSGVAPFHWRRVSMADFAASNLGCVYGKRFRGADDLARWMALRRSNEFVRWAWMDTVHVDSLRKLSTNRRRFLEIVVLADRFFRRCRGCSDQVLRPYPGSATEAFVDFMGVTDSGVSAPPDEGAVRYVMGMPVDPPTRAERLGMAALSALAHELDRDDLLDILDTTSRRRYDSLWRTDDLLDYRVLGAYLLSTETERIVHDPDTARVFDLCMAWWNSRRYDVISWPSRDRLAAMLFRIDAPRARSLFAPHFAKAPADGSFERNGILAAMIRHDFPASRALVERWYWIAQRGNFRRQPSEAKVILDALESTSDETRALRRRLVRDRRFKAPRF